MSAATVTCNHLHEIYRHLKSFIPKGDKAVNVTIRITSGFLFFDCRQSLMYSASVGKIDLPDMSVTVRYFDLTPFLGASKSDTITFDISDQAVVISNDVSEVTLSVAYEFVDVDIELPPQDEFISIQNKTLFAELKRFLLASQIFNIYKKEQAFIVYKDIIVLKTPTVWFQGRCTNLSLNAIVTLSVLKAIVQLEPEYYCLKNEELFIISSFYKCVLPVNVGVEKNNVVDVINTLSDPVLFNTGSFVDTLSAMSQIKPQYLACAIKSDGIVVTAVSAECKIQNSIGTSNDIKHTFRIPVELLLLAFKILGTNVNVQILYSEDTICLRNNTMIIILRVMT